MLQGCRQAEIISCNSACVSAPAHTSGAELRSVSSQAARSLGCLACKMLLHCRHDHVGFAPQAAIRAIRDDCGIPQSGASFEVSLASVSASQARKALNDCALSIRYLNSTMACRQMASDIHSSRSHLSMIRAASTVCRVAEAGANCGAGRSPPAAGGSRLLPGRQPRCGAAHRNCRFWRRRLLPRPGSSVDTLS